MSSLNSVVQSYPKQYQSLKSQPQVTVKDSEGAAVELGPSSCVPSVTLIRANGRPSHWIPTASYDEALIKEALSKLSDRGIRSSHPSEPFIKDNGSNPTTLTTAAHRFRQFCAGHPKRDRDKASHTLNLRGTDYSLTMSSPRIDFVPTSQFLYTFTPQRDGRVRQAISMPSWRASQINPSACVVSSNGVADRLSLDPRAIVDLVLKAAEQDQATMSGDDKLSLYWWAIGFSDSPGDSYTDTYAISQGSYVTVSRMLVESVVPDDGADIPLDAGG